MKFPKLGMRVIKTVIAVFLSISVYVLLLVVNKLLNYETTELNAPTSMYTPFYAAIAAVYALHRDKKSSIRQAKIRSFGSVVGGYYGMFIILISELLLINVFNLEDNNFILFKLFTYLIVSISIIPLIQFTIMMKQSSSVFITCLTFFSVTISSRNGGMPVFLFATNRVLSTLVGIGISLLINNVSLMRNKNKDMLFVSSLDNNLLRSKEDTISAYLKYKLNNLYYKGMPLTFATTRTLSSLEYIFNDVEIEFPLVVMNGAAIYHFSDKRYEDVYKIDNEARLFIDSKLEELNMNSFTYAINDNMLHCFHKEIKNDGEKYFYNIRRTNNFDNFVRASLPSDGDASLYIIVDEKENIDNLVKIVNESKYSKLVDLIVYPFKEIEGNYYYLKINSHDSKKENLINKLALDGEYEKLVVCGSGKTDLALIDKAYFSFCLSSAADYIKESVDLVISDNPEDILKVFEKLYHSYNVSKTIEKLKKKYQN